MASFNVDLNSSNENQFINQESCEEININSSTKSFKSHSYTHTVDAVKQKVCLSKKPFHYNFNSSSEMRLMTEFSNLSHSVPENTLTSGSSVEENFAVSGESLKTFFPEFSSRHSQRYYPFSIRSGNYSKENNSKVIESDKQIFLRDDLEDKTKETDDNLPMESLFNKYVIADNNYKFVENQGNVFDPLDIIMLCRNEIDKNSEECISKILLEKDKLTMKYGTTGIEKQRLLNLSLQQTQFESITSDVKVQLSYAYCSMYGNVLEDIELIKKDFECECRLFKNFFPAYAFKNDVLKTLSENQILIISAENSYCFNIALPIFVEKQFRENLLICCEYCELSKSWLCESLRNFLGNKVISSLIHRKESGNQVLCLTEEEMLQSFLDMNHIYQKSTCVILNIPLIRSVMCDILLANVQDMLKMYKNSKLILLISTHADVLSYQKYFSKFASVSVLKTECLNFPVNTVWKNNTLTPEDDYIEEVIRTILAILVLKDVGDILVFLPASEDLEHTVSILNVQLLELQHNNVKCALIHENNLCNWDIHTLTKLNSSKRIVFLATNCAETLFLPSVQYVIDCGIKNIYMYDNDLKTDILKTMFVSYKNAKLRKTMAGTQNLGICYRIYSKNNYHKDMHQKDYPEVLMVSPMYTIIKMFQYRPNNISDTNLIESFTEKVKMDTLKTLQVYGMVKNNVLTPLGENIAKLPFKAKYSKLILLGLEQGLAFEAVVLVAFFTHGKCIFQSSNNEKQQRVIDATKLQLTQNDSDTLTYLYIYKRCMETDFSKVWCDNHYINYEALQSISNNVIEMCCIVNNCVGLNILHSFSDLKDSFAILTELLFDCFHDNLCVFTGYIKSGYKVLSSSTFALLDSSSFIYQWNNLPQFIIFDHMCSTSSHLVHVTAIPDDIIMKGLRNKTLKYDREDLFEPILLKRVVECIGEELVNEWMHVENGESRRMIENQVRKECESELIFLDLSIRKGHLYIYALPDYIDYAHCIIEDIVKSKLVDILNEHQVEVLELNKGQNKVCIEINWSKGAMALSLGLNSQTPQANIPKKESASSSLVENVKGPVNFSNYLYISWLRRYCTGEGYVTFSNNESFIDARKLGMRHIKLLGTEVFIQLSNRNKYQLHLSGLPSETCTKILEKELQLLLPNSEIYSIELQYKPPFQTSDGDVHKIRSLITMTCAEYDLCDYDILIPKPNSNDVDMVAYIYTHNNEILNFVADILSAEFVKNKKVITNVIYNILIKCNVDVCKVLKPRFISKLTQLERDLKNTSEFKSDLLFSFDIDIETENKAVIKVSSINNALLKLLHRTINDLLEGEILSNKSVKGIENLFFYGGYVWLRNLERAENVYILEDNKTKTVKLYGSLDCCNNAKSQIIKFLEDAENDVMQIIPLVSAQNSSMLLKAIIKEYGVNLEKLVELCHLRSTLLDIKARQLLLRGSREAVEKAENCIKTLSEGLDIINVTSDHSHEICPVCACPASSLAFRLEHCCHLYCIECIQALIEQAQFPLSCCAEKCSKDIVLKDIKRVLKDDTGKIKTLVEKSMNDYLERNRTNIVFCPAADCSMFFIKAELSGNKVNCPLCENEICVSCKVLYHGGYTCEILCQRKIPIIHLRCGKKQLLYVSNVPDVKLLLKKFLVATG